MPTSRVVAEVVEAVRRFPGGHGLAGASLELRRGEIYGVLGPNGAGKTSLIRALCGRLRLDSGLVRVGGADPRAEPRARRALGLVPQEIALYPELTVTENLEVLGRMAGLDPRGSRRAAAQALDWIGMAGRRDDRVSLLSGGLKRRVNLAAGTVHDPELLLLDEPTVGVDPPAREAIHDRLRELRSRGVAVLLATHDLEEAAALGDRVGVLVAGRIAAEGAPRALIERFFGDGRELVVSLSAIADAGGLEALRREGLVSSGEGLVWSGPLRGGLEALAALGRRLADTGLPVAEIRVREPGLRGVFFRVAGREVDA